VLTPLADDTETDALSLSSLHAAKLTEQTLRPTKHPTHRLDILQAALAGEDA